MKLPGVRPSVSHIIGPPLAAAAGLLLRARRAEDVDRSLHGRRPAADANGVTSSVDVGSWTQTCYRWGEVTSQNDRHFVGITRHNALS